LNHSARKSCFQESRSRRYGSLQNKKRVKNAVKYPTSKFLKYLFQFELSCCQFYLCPKYFVYTISAALYINHISTRNKNRKYNKECIVGGCQQKKIKSCFKAALRIQK